MEPRPPGSRVRCRSIAAPDIPAVVDLLRQGFSGRSRSSWEDGLATLARREFPPSCQRFGYCLDAGGRLAGVILLISSSHIVDGAEATFTNAASWYVLPDFRAYAQLLVSVALRDKQVTYTNISPAPHTWPIVERQGYQQYCKGLMFVAAALKRPEPDATIEAFEAGRHSGVAEFELLRRHQELGCSVVVARDGSSARGLVFRRYRIRSGKIALPAMMAIHAPDRQALLRLCGNLGRYFARHAGAPVLVIDSNGPEPGLPGLFTAARGRKYFKGPHRPSLCELADSEFAIFGL